MNKDQCIGKTASIITKKEGLLSTIGSYFESLTTILPIIFLLAS